MSAIYDFNAESLRYIVPFHFELPFDQSTDDSFNEVIKLVEEQFIGVEKKGQEEKLWERWRAGLKRLGKSNDLKEPESDLYSYVKNEFSFNQDRLISKTKNCFGWILRGSKESSNADGHGIIQLRYYPDGIISNYEKQREIEENKESALLQDGFMLKITNVGLLLFRNGVGFFWYEVEFLNGKGKEKQLDSSQLVEFQNRIRELNRGYTRKQGSFFWKVKKSNKRPLYSIEDVNKQNNSNYKTYLTPFSFGQWVYDSIRFLPVHYFADRTSTYDDMLKESMDNLGIKLRGDEEEQAGEQKYGEQKDIKHKNRVADKAILFTYAVLSYKDGMDSAMERRSLAYHIANGYKESYHLSEEVSNTIKRPFDEVYWYATKEGTAYLAWPGEDNKTVFTDTMVSKVKSDYFTLVLKALYQSYSLLMYAEKIQTEISADYRDDDSLENSVPNLYKEINLFLTKSMATSVSHIHHQSEFYNYLKQQLHIQDDVKSVTVGLDALDSLQREQRYRKEQAIQKDQDEQEKRRDEKIQGIMGLFTLLGVFSACVDCYDFIYKFDHNNPENFWDLVSSIKTTEIIFFVIIIFISVLAIIVSGQAFIVVVKNAIDDLKEWKDRNKEDHTN